MPDSKSKSERSGPKSRKAAAVMPASGLPPAGPDRVRFYEIGGMTIRVESDLPFRDGTFQPKFKVFETTAPGPDVITIRHHYELPPWTEDDLGRLVYKKAPWAIYDRGDAWIYGGILPPPRDKGFYQIIVFSRDHSFSDVYNKDARAFRRGGLHSLTFFPTDQILMARLLADRQGCFIHSGGVSMDGRGFLFIGHSEAGKSTMVTMLRSLAEILCDDRVIVRKWPEGYRIHGTWSHGDVSDVSAGSAPLRAAFFLEKGTGNETIPMTDRRAVLPLLLGCLVKPFVTGDWWAKSLEILEGLVAAVPFYTLRFDKSGAVVDLLRRF